jgi:predicted transcriptional regulator
MDTAFDDLVTKVKAIAQGPDGELLIKIVDTLFDRVEDDLTSDDWQAIREGKEDAAQRRVITLEEYEKARGL